MPCTLQLHHLCLNLHCNAGVHISAAVAAAVMIAQVSIGLMLAAELAEMVLEETLMAALGPVGLVLGIVVALVGLFIHSDPPAPPPDHIQEYIDKTLMPFLDSLPLQPYPDKPMVRSNRVVQAANSHRTVSFETGITAIYDIDVLYFCDRQPRQPSVGGTLTTR